MMDLVQKTGTDASPALAEASLHIYYAWRVLRRIPTKNMANQIDWERIRTLSGLALRSRRGGQDSYNKYLQALALSHLGRWTDAE